MQREVVAEPSAQATRGGVAAREAACREMRAGLCDARQLGGADDTAAFELTTIPTPLQREALERLGIIGRV